MLRNDYSAFNLLVLTACGLITPNVDFSKVAVLGNFFSASPPKTLSMHLNRGVKFYQNFNFFNIINTLIASASLSARNSWLALLSLAINFDRLEDASINLVWIKKKHAKQE